MLPCWSITAAAAVTGALTEIASAATGGSYDVADVVSGARHLIQSNRVDQSRVVIMGSSAAGLTVLKAMQEHPGFFRAGIDLYGITDLFSPERKNAQIRAALQ